MLTVIPPNPSIPAPAASLPGWPPRDVRPAPRALLVAGWEAGTAQLIHALEQAAGLRAVAVGDHSALSLVRAREQSDLPCYRHLREMVARVEHDALLIAAPGLVADLAPAATEAGTTLILDATTLTGDEPPEAARLALRHGSPVLAIRPRLRAAGIADVVSRACEEPAWRPSYLDITLEARDAPPLELLDDAVAILGALAPELPERVVASTYGDPDSIGAVVAEARYADGRLGSLRVRTGLFERLVVNAETLAGTIELRVEGDEGLLALCTANEPGELHRFDVDHGAALAREATRIAMPPATATGDAMDLLREAAIRDAIERALDSGEPATVDAPGTAPRLHVMAGERFVPTPRRHGHLRLVNR